MQIGLSIALLAVPVVAQSYQATCLASGSSPFFTSTKYALAFCDVPNYRCCLPVHDKAIREEYIRLLSTGLTCSETLNPAKTKLARVLCASCNPYSPSYLTATVNTIFFSSPVTYKVCTALANVVAPKNFDQCGLNQQAYRGSTCAPNNAVASPTWASCPSGNYLCQSAQSQNFYCSPTQCHTAETPTGFANVPCSANESTCDSSFMFLNDNGGAKPVFFERFPVELIDPSIQPNVPCFDVDDTAIALAMAPLTGINPNNAVQISLLTTILSLVLSLFMV
ncbi:hypothetical protein THRCLA_08873 [Thraustotheca clavata]|uniref:Secreted protein n=1 Tax=Thraustotheca clavata TaxID=74557 RepID=A0A1V9Z1A7_9STRA|nr:hypothetical protein THRCLA_08873 [Thraustotheca clavata]